jgi:hypothetical protein
MCEYQKLLTANHCLDLDGLRMPVTSERFSTDFKSNLL